jgi:hypothetical protein
MTGSALHRKTLISVSGPTLAALVPGRFQPVWHSEGMEMACRRGDGSTQDKELGVLNLQVLQEAKRIAV